MNDLSRKNSANFDLSMDLLDLGERHYGGEKAAEVRGEKYLVFYLDAETYAVSAKQVAEVFQPLAITPLPNIPEWMLGIANFRSEIISVIDLQKLWQKKNLSFSPKSKLIVLQSGGGESKIAFTIDKFSELITLPDEKIERVNEDAFPYICGKTIHESNIVNLIDAGKLLSLNL